MGGLPQYPFGQEHFTSSLSYVSDDYTWCVQRAKFLPLWVSFFRIASPNVWIACVGLGFVNGIILFLFVQFDSKPENRRLDLHHTIYLISLPAWIGISQRFYPKHWPLRLYYMITLIYGMIFFAIAMNFLLEYTGVEVRAYQIHKIAELIATKFRLFGTAAILEKIREQGMVRSSSIELIRDILSTCTYLSFSTLEICWTHLSCVMTLTIACNL